MKYFSTVSMIAVALVCSATMAFGQLLVQDDFNYAAGTDLSANGWSKTSSNPGQGPAVITSAGLTYPGYIGSGAGNAAYFADFTERYSKSMPVPASGSLYAAFMLRVDTATANGGYIVCFYSNNAARGRVWIKNDGAGKLKLGVSGKSASAPTTYDAATYDFGKTYLVVLKYTIVTGTTNDTYTIIVNPTPGTAEPAPNIVPFTDTGSDLGANTSGSSLSIQGRDSLGTGAVFVVDGIRVGQNWNDVVPPPPYYYNGTGAIDDPASWGVNTDGSGKHPSDFAADNQLYSIKTTNKITLTSLWLISGTGSKLIVGSGATLVIGAGGYLSGTVDVDAGGTLTLTHSDWPTFGGNAGIVQFDNAAGISLNDNRTLPASAGYYDLKSGDMNLSGYTLTVKGRLRCLANKVAGSGTFVLDSAATLYIGSPLGIASNGATGDIQSSVRMFSRYANYQYVGAANQVTGSGLPDTVSNITAAMASRSLLLSLSKPLVVTGNLGMNLGKYRLGNFNLTFSNPSNQSDSSYVITDGTGALIRIILATSTTVKTMPVGSASEYRKIAMLFESAPSGTRNVAFRYVTGDTGSVGFPKGITYRYKGGYWSISADSAINPTYRLDIEAPLGFADSTTLRVIRRADATKPWDTVGTVASFASGVLSQAGVNTFGQFALGVGGSAPPPPPGKRYQSEVFASYQIQSDLQFGLAGTKALTMDLYTGTADTVKNRPLVIFIHGGGFKDGDKVSSFGTLMCSGLAKRGYAVASINYRLTPTQPNDTVSFEAMLKALQDAKAAVRFFRKNGAAYGVDTSQIFATGSSAGSITALHLAYLDSAEVPKYVTWANIGGTFEGTSGTPGVSSRIQGVVSNWGAIGDTAWIKKGDVPFYGVHGVNDSTVFFDRIPADGPFKYSDKYIYLSANQKGLTSGLRIFYNTGHTLDNNTAKQDSAYRDAAAALYSILKVPTSVKTETGVFVPTTMVLDQNYPNPFNPTTTIRYGIPAAQKVSIVIYNILGQQVAALIDNDLQAAGMHSVSFDASRFASGVYLYRMTAGSSVTTKKMMLVK